MAFYVIECGVGFIQLQLFLNSLISSVSKVIVFILTPVLLPSEFFDFGSLSNRPDQTSHANLLKIKAKYSLDATP